MYTASWCVTSLMCESAIVCCLLPTSLIGEIAVQTVGMCATCGPYTTHTPCQPYNHTTHLPG